ncbi:MAG: radical SAM protein [Alphaproteobacteria bacterium]|nr:MAG: radical SAM protein [Alphaproteobacteria bacterium]
MSIEVRPVGVKCNIGCQYCYQNVMRDAGWDAKSRTDLPAIKQAIEARDERFHLFGGEPLLMDFTGLADLLGWGFERFGENGIQTNGVLIEDAHIELFRRYRVRVGVSIDGPGGLNDARWAGSLERTRAATAASLRAIERLCSDYEPPSLMVQLTRCNATGPQLEQLCDWLTAVHRLGVTTARIHILEIDDESVRARFGLSTEENIAAFERIMALRGALPDFNLDCNADKREMLMMEDEDTACVWRGCDPYYTEAVMGLGPQGEDHKCGLTDKEGVNFARTDRQNYLRYISLAHTPQQYGGCQDCRFFAACKGQCPGTGMGGDWRNRTENCEVFRELFVLAERELMAEGRQPFSLHPARAQIENALIEHWRQGRNVSLAMIKRDLRLDLGPSL